MRAVRFDRYGDVDVLHVVRVPKPEPREGEISVRVRAAGLNPGESAIRSGAMHELSPADFPEGQGTDLAGVVHAVGRGVDDVHVGDAVIGWSDRRGAQAEYAVLPSENVLPKPTGLAFGQAAVLPVVCATATSALQAVTPRTGETLVVAGASGGVGFVLVQLARRAALERVRSAAPEGVDAFVDCAGRGNVDLAAALGVATDRIDTIIDFEAAGRLSAQTRGMYQLEDIGTALEPVIQLVAAGEVDVPIRGRYALDRVQDAYTHLSEPGRIGKVLLEIDDPDTDRQGATS